MAMQWYLRAPHRAHRKVKFSIGRCTIVATLVTVFMFLLYLRIGDDQRTIQSRDATSVMQARRDGQVESGVATPVSRTTSGASVTRGVDQLGPRHVGDDDERSKLGSPDAQNVTTTTTTPSEEKGPDPTTTYTSERCDGRRVFIYGLPAEFNEQLARNCHNWSAWWNMCDDVSNAGFGVRLPLPESDPMAAVLQPASAWYCTDQFTLEVTIHERLKASPCLTTDAENASLFYIPFYHTLDLIRTLYQVDQIPARDRLGQRLVAWLATQAPWRRHRGRRHVLVLGRIYWDFIRGVGKDKLWGSNLLTHRELDNVTKLLIERSPWNADSIGIPYPTSFHPSSDTDLRAWQTTVRTSSRPHFASVAGGTRTKKLTGSIRDEVFDQCANSTKCQQIICDKQLCVTHPQIIIKMGLESVFCLQPPGDSPTRKGIFDSLQAGCIPVLFHPQQAAQQYLFHLPENGLAYSVMIPQDDVSLHHYDVMAHLSHIPNSTIQMLQHNIVELLPQLLYRHPVLTGPYTAKDAVDVALDGLLAQFQSQSEGEHPAS